tara:strand:- start:379 stop:540 length:162 start_codon:yes stop_codon:yes gene_type:complete
VVERARMRVAAKGRMKVAAKGRMRVAARKGTEAEARMPRRRNSSNSFRSCQSH